MTHLRIEDLPPAARAQLARKLRGTKLPTQPATNRGKGVTKATRTPEPPDRTTIHPDGSITFTFYGRPLSKNAVNNQNWAPAWRHKKEWKQRAWALGLPHRSTSARNVVAIRAIFRSRPQDAGNANPTFTALVDGLTDAGVFGPLSERHRPGMGDEHLAHPVEPSIVDRDGHTRVEVTVR